MNIVESTRNEAARIKAEILRAGASIVTKELGKKYRLSRRDMRTLAQKVNEAARDIAEALHSQISAEIDEAPDYGRVSEIFSDLSTRTGGLEYALARHGYDLDFELKAKFFEHPNPSSHPHHAPAVFKA